MDAKMEELLAELPAVQYDPPPQLPGREPSPRDWVVKSRRMAGLVRRYHVWPVLRQQTVGEHSWQVARIYEELFGAPPAHVERYIRYHDAAEVVIGDPPYPVKAQSPALKKAYDALERVALADLGIVLPELDPIEKVRVKIADWMELTEFGMEERERGNLLAIPIILHTQKSVSDMAREKLPQEDCIKVLAYIRGLWVRHEEIVRAGDMNNYTDVSI
jgi:hypothetical protein